MTFPDPGKLTAAQWNANQIAQRCYAADWLDTCGHDGETAQFLLKRAEQELKALAEIFGYELNPIDTDEPQPTAAQTELRDGVEA